MKNDVVYDANFSVNKHRGMGKYINNLIDVLVNMRNVNAIGLLKNNIIIEKNLSYKSFGYSNYLIWEQISFLSALRNFNGIRIFPYNTAPIFLKPSNNNVLILHDLIFMDKFKSNSLKQKIGAFYRRYLLPLIIKKFQHIITVSEYSKEEIINRFNIDAQKITVIYNSIKVNDQISNPKLIEREKFIFHIGGEPDYKNSKIILYAFSQMNSEILDSYKVKIIGIRDRKVLLEYTALCKLLNIEKKVIFLPYQTDIEIENLYKNASMFVLPSLNEGFGIPIIESFKYGCPLLCSETSCLPEIAGNAAIYFNPRNIASLKNAIESTIINENNFVENNIIRGYERVQQFSIKCFNNSVLNWYDKHFYVNKRED